jgi:hypothetical protein
MHGPFTELDEDSKGQRVGDRAPSGHLPIPSVKGIDPVTYIRVRVYGSVYT